MWPALCEHWQPVIPSLISYKFMLFCLLENWLGFMADTTMHVFTVYIHIHIYIYIYVYKGNCYKDGMLLLPNLIFTERSSYN